MGRPGGGIMALRGHASIQGSTDIPTLFDLLPGYLPMPFADGNEDLDTYVEAESVQDGFWANTRDYLVSLLKAWWGEAATADNDFCFDYLPRLTGSHSTYDTVLAQIDGICRGYFLFGQNPAVGSANARMQRLGMANLDWLVVRDLVMIESATWWKDGPEIETGEMRTEDIGTEVFFLPAAAHTEKSGSFTNTQRLLQWHHQAVEPAGDARSDLWFIYHLGRRIRAKLAASTSETDRPVLDLTWDYPTRGRMADPDADAVLAEINGWGAGRAAAVGLHPAEGRRVHRLRLLDLLRLPRRTASTRPPAASRPASRTGWRPTGAGPGRPTAASCTTAPRPIPTAGRGASARRWSGGTRSRAGGPGTTCPTSSPTGPRPTARPTGATGVAAISGANPFIMQADGKAWLFAPAGLVDGPLPAHYEPQESPFRNLLYGQQHNPVRQIIRHPENRYQPSGDEPGSAVFPYVTTTYRLTEHHTAGRHVPVPALPVRAAARVLLRDLAAARRRARPGAPGLGDDRHGPRGDRGPGAGHRADAAAAGPGPHPAPGRAALALGAERLHHRGRRQRAGSPVAGPERAHPGGQGHGLRHPARAAAGRAGPARSSSGPTRTGPASPTRPERRCEMDAACTMPAPGPGRAGRLRGPPAADGLLHRHLGVHRLQGVRGGLQGVERGARGRAPADRDVLRQHRRAWAPRPGGTWSSSSRRSPSARPGCRAATAATRCAG